MLAATSQPEGGQGLETLQGDLAALSASAARTTAQRRQVANLRPEEPGAVMPPARICEGGGSVSSLPYLDGAAPGTGTGTGVGERGRERVRSVISAAPHPLRGPGEELPLPAGQAGEAFLRDLFQEGVDPAVDLRFAGLAVFTRAGPEFPDERRGSLPLVAGGGALEAGVPAGEVIAEHVVLALLAGLQAHAELLGFEEGPEEDEDAGPGEPDD